MNIYSGKHPVFVSHIHEVEQMAFFLAQLQHRLQLQGKDSGEKYECLLRVRARCSELLLRLSAEESEILLADDRDHWWIRNIVSYVHREILKDRKKVG